MGLTLSDEYWRALDLTADSLRDIFYIYYSIRWKRELCLRLGVRYSLCIICYARGIKNGTTFKEWNNEYYLIVKLFRQSISI